MMMISQLYMYIQMLHILMYHSVTEW